MEIPRIRSPWAAALLFVGLWALLSAATYAGWIHGANHRDFYPWWAGARLALFESRDLYAPETTRAMQMQLYGRELRPDEDQQGFAYPAILVPALLPFWFIDNVEIATAAWEGLSILLIAVTLLLLRAAGGRLPLWAVILLLLWYYPILMIFQAQITALPLLALGGGYFAYTRRRDALAGTLLALGIVKIELVALPLLLLLGLALVERRWRLLAGFAVVVGVLYGFSFALNGWWIPRWLEALGRYAAYAQTAWSFRTAWTLHPLLAVALAIYVIVVVSRARRTARDLFTLSIPLGMLLLPQTPIWGLTMLLIPMALAWRGRAQRGTLALWLIGWLLIGGSAITGWWKIQSLVLPALTLALAVYASREPDPAPSALQPGSEGRYNRAAGFVEVEGVVKKTS